MTEEKAKERIKALREQVRLYRQSLSFYRDQFNEERDIKNVLRRTIDTFTDRRPYIPSRRFETYAEGFEAFGFPLADLSDAWAPGLPLSAAGFESYRYKKD